MSSPRPGQSIEDHVDELRADGKLEDEDVDAVKRFASFLREAGPAPREDPETGKLKVERPWSMEFIERHQEVLGYSDEQVEGIRANREANDA